MLETESMEQNKSDNTLFSSHSNVCKAIDILEMDAYNNIMIGEYL